MAIRDFGGDGMGINPTDYFTAEEIREFAYNVCEKSKDYILNYVDMDLEDFNPDVSDCWTEPKTVGSDLVTIMVDDGEYTVTGSIVLPFAKWKSPNIPQKYVDTLAKQIAARFGEALAADMMDATSDWGI